MKYILLIAFTLLPFASSAASISIATTSPEWSYIREMSDVDTGSEVYARQPYEDEDLLKVFLARNGKIYEDIKWRTNKLTNKVEDIDFGTANKKNSEEQRIWNLFLSIAGQDFVKKYVGYYVTYRDVDDPALGAVWRVDTSKEPSWVVGINANAADFTNQKWERDMVITLLHEYGHLLTLNKTQMKYVQSKKKACQKIYRSSIGCPYKQAYFTKYVDTFWDMNDRAHNASTSAEIDPKKVAKQVRKYYKEHPFDFVTQYAATSPEEDMAESFVDFVLQAKPNNTLLEKNRKILFFYQYPEFVSLRTTIRQSIRQYF